MGAYLSEPVTKKHREFGSIEKYGGEYATCSMQGWRKHQEDAHIRPQFFVRGAKGSEQDCLIFAGVYDGHGGAEIARYAANNIVKFLVDLQDYKRGAYEKALQQVYLQLDEKIKSPKAQIELKHLEELALSQEKADREEMKSKREKERTAAKEVDTKDTSSPSDKSDIAENNSVQSHIEENESNSTPSEKPVLLTPEMFEGISNSEEFEKKIMSIISANQGGEDIVTEEEQKKSATVSSVPSEKCDPAASRPDDSLAPQQLASSNEPADTDLFVKPKTHAELDPDSYGIHSGCTATSILIVNYSKIICANAGDTRCVLCRDGIAIPLSRDHNPDQEDEYERIYKAGGTVNEEGRVEGNLNLSRALGDLFYKGNEKISAEEQMITSNPEIQTITLSPKDEFLIIACDGIWNVMENQEVIDFVREKMSKGMSLLDTAGALCDACLSDGSDGDGSGCDNESVILLKFNKASIPKKGEQCSSPRVVSGGPPSLLKRRNDDSTDPSSSPESSEKRQRKTQG